MGVAELVAPVEGVQGVHVQFGVADEKPRAGSIRLVGSHAGVEIGEDGPSQMALEDLAALRAVHGSVVLYPADATCTVSLVATMADTAGIAPPAAPTRCFLSARRGLPGRRIQGPPGRAR